MCLSESAFLSLSGHFGGKIDALGYERFLSLFDQYFAKVHRIESMRWLHLFSGGPADIKYRQIIFIGKDRQGDLRKRWEGLSREGLIFIEMYPGDGNSVERGAESVEGRRKDRPPIADKIYVEDYQLAQLKQY